MIFQDASGKAGMDSRMLDIHVRLALPNVHQQKCFRFRDQIYELPVRSAADKGLPVATAVSTMKAIAELAETTLRHVSVNIHFSTTPNTPCQIVNNGT